jgi:hypothetical protein
VNVNATLFNAHRALAAAIALTLAVVAGVLAPPLADDLDARLNDRAASQPALVNTEVPPATWAHNPLASPLDVLRDSRSR